MGGRHSRLPCCATTATAARRPACTPALTKRSSAAPGRIVIGSRLHKRKEIPPARYWANRFANFWISWAAGYAIADSQSGFRIYPAVLFTNAKVNHGEAYSFVFESEILVEAVIKESTE